MSYIEKSRRLVSSLDVDAIAELEPTFGLYDEHARLGELDTVDGPLFTELFIDDRDASVPGIEILEIAQAIADNTPKDSPLLPVFTGFIAIEGVQQPVSIIKEDITKDKSIVPELIDPVSPTLAMLEEGFKPMTFKESGKGILNIHEVQHGGIIQSMAGVDRIDVPMRDIFNPIFYRTNWLYFSTQRQQAREAIDSLTIRIPQDSPLGRALEPALDNLTRGRNRDTLQ